MSSKPIALFDPDILRRAAIDAVVKLAPRQLVRNPVMFVTGCSGHRRYTHPHPGSGDWPG